MAGILLSAGPVATQISVKRTSHVFVFSVNKGRFESAAQKLEAANFGTFGFLKGNQTGFFLKKKPEEVCHLLLMNENADLCTLEEYFERFHLNPPASITPNIKASLVNQGLVPAGIWGSDSGLPDPQQGVDVKEEL